MRRAHIGRAEHMARADPPSVARKKTHDLALIMRPIPMSPRPADRRPSPPIGDLSFLPVFTRDLAAVDVVGVAAIRDLASVQVVAITWPTRMPSPSASRTKALFSTSDRNEKKRLV